MPGPVVDAGERVAFRTVERGDAAFRQRAATDPRVRYPLGVAQHRNEREAEGLVESMDEGDDRLAFVVCLDGAAGTDAGDDRNGDAARCRNGERSVARDGSEDGEPTPVGLVHAYGIGTERAHLAYWLVPDYHGEGYGREAAALLVDRAFRATPVHSVGAGAFAFNDASRSILESLGFTEEYRRREAEYVEGAYRDFVQYGLLRREWRER